MRTISKIAMLTAFSVLLSQAVSAACPGFPRNNYTAYEHPMGGGYPVSGNYPVGGNYDHYQYQQGSVDYYPQGSAYQSAPVYQDNYRGDMRGDMPMYRDNYRSDNYYRDSSFRGDMRGDFRNDAYGNRSDNFRNDSYRSDMNANPSDFDQTQGSTQNFPTDTTSTSNQGMRR